jgi:hypothetical protein
MTQGGISHQLDFFLKLFSGFEILITFSVILRHLEAELSLKLIRGYLTNFFLIPSN